MKDLLNEARAYAWAAADVALDLADDAIESGQITRRWWDAEGRDIAIALWQVSALLIQMGWLLTVDVLIPAAQRWVSENEDGIDEVVALGHWVADAAKHQAVKAIGWSVVGIMLARRHWPAVRNWLAPRYQWFISGLAEAFPPAELLLVGGRK